MGSCPCPTLPGRGGSTAVSRSYASRLLLLSATRRVKIAVLRDAQMYCAGSLSRREQEKASSALGRSLPVLNHTPVTLSQRSVASGQKRVGINAMPATPSARVRSGLAAHVARDARGPSAGLEASGNDRRVNALGVGPNAPVGAALVVRVHAHARCPRRGAKRRTPKRPQEYANELSTKREGTEFATCPRVLVHAPPQVHAPQCEDRR